MSHFNISLIVRAKSQDSVHKPQCFKRRERRAKADQTKVLLLTSQAPYRRPHQLTTRHPYSRRNLYLLPPPSAECFCHTGWMYLMCILAMGCRRCRNWTSAENPDLAKFPVLSLEQVRTYNSLHASSTATDFAFLFAMFLGSFHFIFLNSLAK